MKKLKQQSSTSRDETQSSKSVRRYSDPLIPDDLLVEIFSRVPSKSIARFRCVSKFLVSILRRHDFTELFLTKSLTRPRLLFAIETKGKLLFYSSPQLHNPDANYSIVVTPYHTSFPEYVPIDYCSTVCGLVLLQGYLKRKVRVIWNPATGEFLTLPKVLLKQKNLPKVEAKSNRTHIAGVHLGYDPIGKHFKVLCMTSSRDERPNTHQVLTLESGKRVWRRIEHKFHFERNDRMRGEICINGVLYFGGRFGEGGRSCRIVCFDFTSEKFRFINMNEDMKLVGSYVVGGMTLFNYKGKLGIDAHRYENRYEKRLVMWILEDDVNHPKWSELVFVLPHSYDDIVGHRLFVGMASAAGETVVLASHSKPFYVKFYNLESRTFNRVCIKGLEGFKKHQSVTLHTFVDYVENMKFL